MRAPHTLSAAGFRSLQTLRLVAAVLVVALPMPAGAVTFSDDTFAPGDWTATVLSGNPANTHTYTQETSGGNPGAWRRMVDGLVFGGDFAVFHEYTAASFDPATIPPGSAVLIDYQEDNVAFDGGTYSVRPALQQDGIVYVGGPPTSGNLSVVWNTTTKGPYGPSRFQRWPPTTPIEYPDFSPSGSPIHFGYLRRGSWSPITYDLGIDNWQVTVTTVPVGTVLRQQKFSDTTGTWLDDIDRFGECVAYLGDVDGNGFGDLATSTLDDDAGTDTGAVWILLMDRDPISLADEAPSTVKIRDGDLWFPYRVEPGDRLGQCGEGIGDLNHDGVPDLAVGSEQAGEGAVWILFLNPDGSVRAERRIASGAWGFPTGVLAPGDNFGRDIARLGDLDGDGTIDLAVGAPNHGDGGPDRGAVFVLFLDPDGYVKDWKRISHSTLPALGLDDDDRFGLGVTGPGDIDGDGTPDLAVGAFFDDDAGSNAGAVYVLFMNPDGTVRTHQKLSDAAVGGGLDANDRFGIGLTAPGDLDGDGVPDLGVGASRDDDGGTDYGAVYLILLNPDGSAKGFQKISATAGGFTGPLNTGDEFGMDLEAWVGEGGQRKLAIGARQDDDGGLNRGALHILDIASQFGGAVCGDSLPEKDEACDDGNTSPGDGCNATCELEQALFLSGTAGGGTVTATVDGIPVVAPTTTGQSAEDALVDLAAAINADAGLMALGRSAVAHAQALYVDGTASLASGDGGLTAGERDDLQLVDSHLELNLLSYTAFEWPRGGSLRVPVEQGVAPPMDVLAAQDGGLEISAPLPFSASGTVTPTTSVGLQHAFGFVLSGVSLPPCVPGGSPVSVDISTGGAGEWHDAKAGLGPGGVRCADPFGYPFEARFGQHILATRRTLTSITTISSTSGLPAWRVYGGAAPLGLGVTGTFQLTVLGSSISARVAGLPWTTGSATMELGPNATFGIPLFARSRGLTARTPGGVGALNLVTPMAVARPVGYNARTDGVFTRVRLRLVPEPGVGVSLTLGAILLALLGRRRRS